MADQRYLDLLTEMAELHKSKCADYGRGSDPLANLRASAEIGVPAWKGAFIRLLDKVHRIKSFCLNGNLKNEGVEDSFRDLAAYSLLCLILYREGQDKVNAEAEKRFAEHVLNGPHE